MKLALSAWMSSQSLLRIGLAALLAGAATALSYSPSEQIRSSEVPPEQERMQPVEQGAKEPVNKPLSAVKSALPTVSVVQESSLEFQLCQALSPAAPVGPRYIDCIDGQCRPTPYGVGHTMPWQLYAQGEYVGHGRTAHVPEYRLRVDDVLECIYRLTRAQSSKIYRLNIGDQIRVESFSDPNLNRDLLVVQPDGMITLRLLGEVAAAGKGIEQLREEIERLYSKYYKEPSITVTPIKVNTRLEDLRDAVITRFGFGGQIRNARVIPDGTISLPAIGAVPAQGLTLTELKAELDSRYDQTIEGVEVTPVLLERAPRSVYVLGEVRSPGRQVLSGPTTLMQAVAMAGGWNVGANLRNIVIFRRGDDWRLLATRVDMWGPLMRGNEPCPAGELWLSDSDVVLVPKMAVLRADEWANLLFTRGIYQVAPMQYAFSFGSLGTL